MSAQQTWALDIVAAEDTPSDIDILQLALKRCGQVHSLKIVRDGLELIDYLQGKPPFNQPDRQAPNIILMDLKMPRLDGFDVLKWLRNHPDCSVIPVIIISGSGLDQHVLQAHRLGANAYFEKPSTFEQLEEVLRSILLFWSRAKRPPVNKFPC